jgi:hypothetical protein
VDAGCEGAGSTDHLWIGGVSVGLAAPTAGPKAHNHIGVRDEDKVIVS